MEIEKAKLDEQISLGKQYEKAWMSNWLKLGEILKEIHTLYEEKYSSFKECIEHNFSFDVSYAYKFIKIYEKYGSNVERFHELKKYGIKFLIISCYIKDDHIDEIIEEIEEQGMSREVLQSRVKRLKSQAGTPPHYQHTQAEATRKLIRQYDELINQFSSYIELKDGLIESLTNWLSSAKKQETKEISKLILDIETKLREI